MEQPIQQLEYAHLKVRKMMDSLPPQYRLEQLPKALLSFMQSRNIPLQQLLTPIPRYVRVKHSHILTVDVSILMKQLAIGEQQIVRMDEEFYAIDPSVKINHCSLYQQGLLFGMDISSAMPVRCLDLKDHMRVLELCSAPGNKSMMMADHHPNLTIFGVEISENRANVMKSLIKKYQLDNSIKVIVEDGLTFKDQLLFDRVLVDAECTHEGSIKHIQKFIKNKPYLDKSNKKEVMKEKKMSKQQEKQFKTNNSNPYTTQILKANEWKQQDFEERFLDQVKLQNLHRLQLGLLQNGFNLLKDGGILVYSTCSYDYTQNQEIVDEFISTHHQIAEVMNAEQNLKPVIGWKEGKIKGTLRFSPSISMAGGMFVCKIKKKLVISDLTQHQ